MFKFLGILFVSFASSATAHATLPDPCTPVEQTRPHPLRCSNASYRYGITLHTLKSPPNQGCEGSRYFERHIATVYVTSGSQLIEEYELEDGQFTYSLGFISTFTSKERGLHFNNCFTPVRSSVAPLGY